MDELGFLAADEEVASERSDVRRSSGEGEQFTVIVECASRGTEASSFLFTLNDDDSVRQSGDDAVALEEIAGKGFSPLDSIAALCAVMSMP